MRRNMLKRLGCAVLAGIMVMGVTACSKKEASTTSADGVRHIVVGTGNGAAPFCYLDENGNSVGYDIDVLNELDARLPQYEFEIQAMDFSTLIVSIDSGSINFLSHQIGRASCRERV